uniref:RhoGAP domain-containing protein n=2 Tax=Wuchereria bancrofti TaxID=6293 RepID=A0AAF5PG60_WUCBA
MVEKVTAPETKIATTISNNIRNNIFGHISPLVGRNNNSNHCSSPKNNSTTVKRSSSIKKLIDQDHFHYEKVELGSIGVTLIAYEPNASSSTEQLRLQIESAGQKWCINRSIDQLCEFDHQLHRCVFDRSQSHLKELALELKQCDPKNAQRQIHIYLQQLSHITGNLMCCYSVLKFLEVDSHGNRFLAAEETPINTPAIASAVVTKDFKAETGDQISLRVGDIVSIIEKVTPFSNKDKSWWKAKLTIAKNENGKIILGRKFEVGLFPSECVKIFDDKTGPSADQQLLSSKKGALVTPINGHTFLKPTTNLTSPSKKSTGCHPPRRDRSLVRTLLRRHAERQTPLVFGTDLVEYLQKTGEDVPLILKKCVEVIEMHGIVTGVYRQCGIQSNIQKLRNDFDSGHLPDLRDEAILKDIHSVSSLLKQYFRQLPNPLFTFELYPEFIGAYETTDDEQANRFKDVIGRLPREHYRTAKYLIRHLTKLCQCTHLTDMNSKNLAIVWAPNLFRCPPCVDDNFGGSDSSLLQGLNAQTGLCNYILAHAVYLFSLENDSLSLPENAISRSSVSSCSGGTLSPDLDRRRFIDVNGGPATLPTFHTIIEKPRHRETSTHPGSKWRRMLRGPSMDNAFASLRTRWKKHGEAYLDNDNSTNSVKWRRSPSDTRASLRAARSASLISFVTKSVEEFRNGVLRSWRHCAPTLRDDSITNGTSEEQHSTATAVATELVRRRGLTSFLANDQQPSTSTDTKLASSIRGSIPEAFSLDTSDSGNSRPPSITQNDCIDDGVSLSSDSYRFFGFYEDEQQSEEGVNLRDIKEIWTKDSAESEHNSHVAFNMKTTSSKKNLSRNETEDNLRSSSTDEWSDVVKSNCSSNTSSSTGSLHNDCSRYDNVPIGENAGEGRYVETPLSFYDLPQNSVKPVRSNVQLYFF